MAKPSQVLLTTWLDHPTSAFVEWVAHHRALGVNKIHVFLSNTRTEAQPLVTALAHAGLIETNFISFDTAETGEQIRNAALRAAELEASETSGMGIFLAPDEYLILPRHDTVQDLMADLKIPHALSAPVRVFFSETMERLHTSGPVLAQVTHRAPHPAADGTGGREWRSIVKLGLWDARLPGYPTGKVKTNLKRVRWLNGSGQPMPTPHANHTWQRDDSAFGADLISIARVPVPSVETLLLRAAYVQPGKAQAMVEDLIPIIDAAQAKNIKENAFARTRNARHKEMEDILANPPVKQAYQSQCDEEVARISAQTRRHHLWRSILEHLDDPVSKVEQPQSDQISPAPASLAVPPPAPLPEQASITPPSENVADLSRGIASAVQPDPSEPVKEHPNVPDEFARVITDPPPQWFAEIYPGGHRQGFFTRLEHHAIVHIERDSDTLIVTFDNISNVHDISYGREPWAYRFVREKEYSHLSVIARRKDWYRDLQLIREMDKLAGEGLFARYKKVVMAGTSMGGFAAMAFSSLAPGCTVLAYSPQSTLDQELVPWEDRFGMGQDRNWSLPYSDASFEIQEAKQVYVIYDPFFEPDKRHIERLEGDNITPLKSWFSGHFTAVFIRRANLIKPLFQMVIDETLTEEAYYQLLRGRRSLPWYRKALEQRALETGHTELAKRIGPAFQKIRKRKKVEA